MWFDYDDEYDWTDDHPYDDDIEDTILAWKRLADSYSEEALQLSKDLYHKLANIKCKKVLEDQMIRLGKTQIHYYFYKHLSRRRFQRFKRNFGISTRQTFQKKNISKIQKQVYCFKY